jgi:TonB family protein
MRRSGLCTLFALMLLAVSDGLSFGQAAPETPNDPAAVFAAAAPAYDFSDPSLKPWHLKASYQLYDDAGKQVTEQGTYEYWWASPTVYRSTWTRGASSHTDWHTSDGKHYYASTGPGLNFFEYQLQSRLLSPLPDAEDYAPEKTYFRREEVKFDDVKAPRIMIVPKMPQNGHITVIPLGLFPTYCFDPKIPVLIAETSFGGLSVDYRQIVRVQNRYLAKVIVEGEGTRRILSATVDEIEGLAPADPALVPPPGTKREQGGAVTVPLKVMQGKRIGGPMPIYPSDAKEARAEGTVTLKALIGKDGRIHNLKVTDVAFPSLVESAMWAVSQWTYTPYLLNGDPVDVETEIRVVYKLGQ